MSALKYFACILLFFQSSRIYSQNQNIFIFDPADVSTSFQYSFTTISSDGIFVDNSISGRIFDYDALFLFIGYQYALNQTEGDLLIEYLETQRPIYVYTKLLSQTLTEVTFWNFIGFDNYAEFPLYVLVDSVVGTNSTFSSEVNIDTSFWSPQMPGAQGNIIPLLKGMGSPMNIDVAYLSGVDSIDVIIDQYHQIYHPEFLRKVIEHFDLNLRAVNILFFPQVDTAWVFGGCTGPDLISHNLVSTPERDSITIEPGPSSALFYYDSTGNTVPVDKYYFIVEDSLNQYDYELWFHPKSWPPFDPILIPFDSVFYFQQNSFNLQLLVKQNGVSIDSLSQSFRADWGLSVEDSLNQYLPNDYKLYQNFPNPYNISTYIKYYVPDQVSINNEFVTLIVYDIMGNEVATLVNERKPKGEYIVPFDGTNLSSGIYFYQLKVGNYLETRKMVFLK